MYSFCSQGVWTIQEGGLFLLTVSSFFPQLFHLEEIIFFILLGLALFAGWLGDKDLRVRTPVDLPLILLVVWILLTIPFSLNPEYSFEEWRKLVAQCLVFYWAVSVMREISERRPVKSLRPPFRWLEGMKGQSSSQIVFPGILLGTLLLSGVSLVDFIAQGGNWKDRDIRGIVPGSDYNWLSTYLILALPIVLYCVMTSLGLWRKTFSVCIFVLGLLAQAASYSRAGWLTFVVQMITWGLITRRRVLLMSGILGIILVSVVLVGLAQRGYQADTLDTWTVKTRVQVWQLGTSQIISHPIVGIGYGNNIFQPLLADSPMGDSLMHLHNTPLMVGVGSGLPALGFFLWVFVRLAVELFPKINQNWTDTEALKLCLGIVLVGFFCRNLFDYMFAGSLAYLFWILMACGLETSVKGMPRTEPKYPHCAIGAEGSRGHG